jgi:hypothetical protein
MIPARSGKCLLPLEKTTALSKPYLIKMHNIPGMKSDILNEKFKFRKVCACLIPHLLTSDKIWEQVEKASLALNDLVQRLRPVELASVTVIKQEVII